MNKTKNLTIKKEVALDIVQFITLLTLASLAPLLKNQAITGSLVNATLFVATVILGYQKAILVGFLPSVFAIYTGLLPPILAFMIPFIILGNAILILVFDKLKAINYWLGVFFSSFSKFTFLCFCSYILQNLLIKEKMFAVFKVMMSWPQLLTAFAGGVIAFIFLKGLKKT